MGECLVDKKVLMLELQIILEYQLMFEVNFKTCGLAFQTLKFTLVFLVTKLLQFTDYRILLYLKVHHPFNEQFKVILNPTSLKLIQDEYLWEVAKFSS